MALTLVTSDLIVGLDYSKLSGTVTTWNQNTTGSAATLTTARNIGGVSFNGSVAINLPGVNTAGNQNTSGTAAGLSATLVVGSGGTGVTSITALKNVLDDETWTFANAATFSGGGVFSNSSQGKVKLIAGSNEYSSLEFANASGTTQWEISKNNTHDLYFYKGGHKMMLKSGGNVGIGTTSPSARLTVKDSVDNTFDSGIAIIRSASSQTGYINMKGGAMNFNSPSIPIVFRQAGSAKLSISSGGDATFSGTATFTKDQNADTSIKLFNPNTGTSTEATIYVTNSSANANGLFLGTTGVNTTTAGGFVQDGSHIGSGSGASGGLSIMTRAAADIRFYTNGHTNERMRITSGGNVDFKSHISINSASGAAGAQGGITINQSPQNSASRNWKIWSDDAAWGDFNIKVATAYNGSTYTTPLNISSGGVVRITKDQVTTNFDSTSFLRLHPSDTTDSGGYTNMIFGTSTVNNYGVAIGGLRSGADGTPSFSIRMLNDSITGTEVMNISSGGNATFSATTSANVVISRDNMFVGAGQFYIGAENGSTNDTYRQEVSSGIFKIKSRKSGTWTDRLKITSAGNIAIPTAYNDTSSKVIFIESGITDGSSTYQGSLLIQAGGEGSAAYGAGIRLKGHAHATDPGSVEIGLSAVGGAKFTIDSYGAGGGSDLFTVLRSGNVGIGTNSPSSKLDVQGTTGTRNYNTTSGQANSIYETSRYYAANGNTVSNISIVTTTAFPTMGSGGYILVEVSASGYGGSGSNGLVFSWIGGGYGGHFGTPGSLSYHPVQIIADTHHSSCNVSVYYPSYNNVGITISNASATSIAGIMRVKITTTY